MTSTSPLSLHSLHLTQPSDACVFGMFNDTITKRPAGLKIQDSRRTKASRYPREARHGQHRPGCVGRAKNIAARFAGAGTFPIDTELGINRPNGSPPAPCKERLSARADRQLRKAGKHCNLPAVNTAFFESDTIKKKNTIEPGIIKGSQRQP